MTLLQKYIRLRGFTTAELADQTGMGYHSVQKVLIMSPYSTRGGLQFRRSPEVRAAIAAALCLPYDHAWGPSAARHLRRYIQKEIVRQAERAAVERRTELEKLYLRAS